MGSPYLKSGETIVLTTNRVSADTVLYDVMLTTERVFLIDNRNERFEPRIIPLATILSVQGGKTPAHDPAIVLQFRTSESGVAREPLNLVFSQNPNENRKPERDEWVITLIRLSVAWQERAILHETPAAPAVIKKDGLHPTARHGVAPEKVLPLSEVVERRMVAAPVTVIPEQVAGSGEIPVREAFLPARAVIPTPEQLPAESASEILPDRGTTMAEPAPTTRVVIPQIIEELLPVKTRVNPPGEQERAVLAEQDHESWSQSFRSTVRSLAVPEVSSDQDLQIPEPVSAEPVPIADTAMEAASTVPPPAGTAPEEITGMITVPDTGAGDPETMEQAPATGPVPEPAPERDEAGLQGITEPQVTGTVPESTAEGSLVLPSLEEGDREGKPEPAESRQIRHPLPPAHEIRPIRTMLAYAVILLLLIALAAAAVLFLLPPATHIPDTMAAPVLPALPVPTAPPETMLPVPVLPATTRIAQTVPSVPGSMVPQTDVWVRVNSTAYYFGSAGNPEFMQPVSGRGDNYYRVIRSDRPVQVSVQKQDNSGAVLTVGIYRNGTLISTRSVTSPMGTVDLLIDPLTALAPGLSRNDLYPEQKTTTAGVLENY